MAVVVAVVMEPQLSDGGQRGGYRGDRGGFIISIIVSKLTYYVLNHYFG